MRRYLSLIIILFSTTLVLSQNSSVYTRYGIGDLEYGYSSRMLGIGDLGIAELDPEHILVTNPASWASLNRTRIEFGLGYKGVVVSNNDKSAFTSEIEFSGITFGFPVSRDLGIGIAAGLVPYSNVSYEVKIKNEINNEIPAYTDLYEGKGGLSKIFLGSSVQLPLNFILGASVDYYFGNQNYTLTREFLESEDFDNSVFENSYRSTGGGASVGIISSNLASDFGINALSDLRLGFSLNYLSTLTTDSVYTSTTNYLVDTTATGTVDTEIPIRINTGLSFSIKEEYNFNIDYAFQDLSKYKFNGYLNSNLKSANKFSAAFEFKPKRALGQTNWDQMVWRFGLSYEQSQYRFKSTDLNRYSVFGGFSYPLGVDNTIDFAVEYSNRGTKDNNLLNEQAIKLYMGLSFGELWFLRFDK